MRIIGRESHRAIFDVPLMRRDVYQLEILLCNVDEKEVSIGIAVVSGVNHPATITADGTEVETLGIFVENTALIVAGVVTIHIEGFTISFIAVDEEALGIGRPTRKPSLVTRPRSKVGDRTIRCHHKHMRELITITILLIDKPIVFREPGVHIYTAIVRLR